MTTELAAEAADPGATSLAARVLAADAAWAEAGGAPAVPLLEEVAALVAELVTALEAGEVRAAAPDASVDGGWRVDAWVKTGILLGFRLPGMTEYRDGPIMAARDRAACAWAYRTNLPKNSAWLGHQSNHSSQFGTVFAAITIVIEMPKKSAFSTQ